MNSSSHSPSCNLPFSGVSVPEWRPNFLTSEMSVALISITIVNLLVSPLTIFLFFFPQCNFIYNSNTYTTYNTDMTLTFTLTIYLLITLLILTLLIHALLYNTMLMLLRKILVLQYNYLQTDIIKNCKNNILQCIT